MERIVYGTYTFPCSPQSLRIVHSRQVVTRVSPFGTDVVEDYGLSAATVTGEGEFFGADAEENRQIMLAEFRIGGTRTLTAGGETFPACFESLTMTRDVSTRAIRFSFRFVEVPQAGEEVGG